jgi:hypothetical protein
LLKCKLLTVKLKHLLRQIDTNPLTTNLLKRGEAVKATGRLRLACQFACQGSR